MVVLGFETVWGDGSLGKSHGGVIKLFLEQVSRATVFASSSAVSFRKCLDATWGTRNILGDPSTRAFALAQDDTLKKVSPCPDI